MAEGKKSFVMYCEWRELFEKLTDEQSGKLIKHIFAYVNDDNPEPPDVLTDVAFTQIKQQFKRDLKKYEAIAERNKLNGSKGGRPKTQNNPVGSLETQTNPENPIKDKGERISDKGEMIKDNGFSKKKNGTFENFVYPNVSDKMKSSIAEFMEHRKSKKSPIKTQLQFDKLLAKLKRMAKTESEAIAIIDNSIANGWTGIFESEASKQKQGQKVLVDDEIDRILTRSVGEQKQLR